MATWYLQRRTCCLKLCRQGGNVGGQVSAMTGTYDLVTALLFQQLVSHVINLDEAWPSVDAASERLQLVNHTILHFPGITPLC